MSGTEQGTRVLGALERGNPGVDTAALAVVLCGSRGPESACPGKTCAPAPPAWSFEWRPCPGAPLPFPQRLEPGSVSSPCKGWTVCSAQGVGVLVAGEAHTQPLPWACSCLRWRPACVFPPLTFAHKSLLTLSQLTPDYHVLY